MSHDTTAFRKRYRRGIGQRYSAWLHGGFVLAYGAAVLVLLLGRLDAVDGWDWLAIPIGLVFFNLGEYTVHRQFGHHKRRFGTLFYKRHSGDHHSFFDDTHMSFEQLCDWRVIFFPAWLIVLFSAALLPAWWLIAQFNPDAAVLFCATLLAGYLSYEFFHACQHLPATHWLTRLPWIRQTRRLHQLHHRREHMRDCNFNLVLPLTDWLLGTLYWEAEPRHGVATVSSTKS